MNKKVRAFDRLVGILVIFLLSVATLQPARANTDPPAIAVGPVWRPPTQLTSISGDTRYVDAEIYVTSSVEFWTAEFTCTVSPTVLQSYTPNGIPGDPGSVQVVRWGPNWNMPDGAVGVNTPFTATGAMTFAASRLGGWSPMGSNGVKNTFLAATIRYQVKTSPGTSPLTCTASLLDRNGVSVLTPTIVAPAPLTVIAGYTISGNVSYQGRATKSGIGVSCSNNVGTLPTVTTDASGHFSITTRVQGIFNCKDFGNISGSASSPHDDLYMTAWSAINLQMQSYTLLPAVLASGNLDRTASQPTEHIIDMSDLSLVTSNYLQNPSGDINGDGKTDKVDLAIVSGNLFLSDAPIDSDYAQHVLYGLSRAWSDSGPDNRIWLGGTGNGHVTQFVSGTNRDYWPALSPDGSKLAFTRKVYVNNNNNWIAALFVGPMGNGIATQLTPTTTSGNWSWMSGFAPSWSPDGSKIAFICGWYSNPPYGWTSNDAALCLVDPNGKNFQQVTGGVKVYPPAWLDSHTLLYADDGTNTGSPCPNSICEWDLTSGQVSQYVSMVPLGADMPVIRGSRLFYRVSTGTGNGAIRMAEIQSGGGLPPSDSVTPGFYHFYLRWTPDGGTTWNHLSDLVDYFTVSPNGRAVMYDEWQSTPGEWQSGLPIWTAYGQGAYSLYSWGQPYQKWIDDGNQNQTWDGSSQTELWGLRNTIDWEP